MGQLWLFVQKLVYLTFPRRRRATDSKSQVSRHRETGPTRLQSGFNLSREASSRVYVARILLDRRRRKIQTSVDSSNQIHQTVTIMETVQVRLQDLADAAAEFNAILLWQNCKHNHGTIYLCWICNRKFIENRSTCFL